MASFSLTMIDALCQIVIAQGLVPTTTLAASANPGDDHLTIALPAYPAPSPFLWNGMVSFWDGTDEEPYRILTTPSVTSLATTAKLPLDLTGTGRTGLEFGHASGSTIACNLIDTIPVKTGNMLANGWPVVAVFVLDRSDRATETQGFMPQVVLNVGYQLPSTAPTNSVLDAQLYVRRVTRRAETDLDRLVMELQDNNRVIIGSQAQAMEVDNFVRALRLNIEDEDQPLWEQYLTMTISGAPRQLTPRFAP